ncbi:MAG: methionyl-tRNA formyltransferase [Eubacterium sp.]|nr:methionyl-tRNA formyltransferase [Eubacterium sp.]
MKVIIATIKSWNIDFAKQLKNNNRNVHNIIIISNRNDLTIDYIREFDPDYIFFPHWSYIIPAEIFENYKCVVFHMTDLPYGRGGSPLQNLIVRGHKETKISAIAVTQGLDEGPIYFKENLSLDGSADEIFRRASQIIFEKMIPRFLDENIEAVPQEGEPVIFKRRKPAESELQESFSLNQIYDYIRMLDAEGYPNAFFKFGNYKLQFTNASYDGTELRANVVIREVEDE